MQLLGIAGSLRQGSYNRALLRAAGELLPEDVELVEHDLRELACSTTVTSRPPEIPSPSTRLKDAIREADGLLIATPEYNRGIPGVLKNAIDWAPRPPLASPLARKPVAIMGASTGPGGTRRAQEQLHAALEFPGALLFDGALRARAGGVPPVRRRGPSS